MTAQDARKPSAKKSRIPIFASREEEAEWWDTHDITDYLDELQPVTSKVKLRPVESLTFDLDARNMDLLRAEAKKQGFPVEVLVQIWVLEGLQRADQANQQEPAETPVNGSEESA
jgi:CopG antitoxin of type II toxin-antitoxin system